MQAGQRRNKSQVRSGSAQDSRISNGCFYPNQQRKISFDEEINGVVDIYTQEQNEVDNSIYVPQTLSTNISILINSRPNLHKRPNSGKKQKVRRNPVDVFFPQAKKKDIADDSYYARVLRNVKEHITRDKQSDRLQSTKKDLFAFRKRNFGIVKDEISMLSSTKPAFKGRKNSDHLEEDSYSFDFNRHAPSRISMNDFLEKIKPDVVPQVEPNIHNRSFYLAQQTQFPLPQKKLDLDPLNNTSQLFLSRTTKSTRPQSGTKKSAAAKVFNEEVNSMDRTWRDLGFEITKDKFANDCLTLDQRCSDRLQNIMEEQNIGIKLRSKSRHEKRSEDFIKEAEKLKQEIYNDIQHLETSNLSFALKYQETQKKHRSLTPYGRKLKL